LQVFKGLSSLGGGLLGAAKSAVAAGEKVAESAVAASEKALDKAESLVTISSNFFLFLANAPCLS
jgi:hypothetical protein